MSIEEGTAQTPFDARQLHHRLIESSSPHPATPVVLLHGLMGFAANWGRVWPELQASRSVLVLDQRGHGRSPKPPHGYAPTDYARDVQALLHAIGWNKCHIVGHSMGGRVALRFASLFPELTASLTMEDSGAASHPERVNWIRTLLGAIPTPFAGREEAKAFFAEHFRNDPLTGSFLQTNLESRADGTLDWRFFPPGMVETIERGRATDAMAEFAALRMPTLLVRGARSREFPAEEAERMRDSRAGVELVTIEGAGHFVHAEKPREFNRALVEFLARTDSAG